jgi:hypothetical protein
MMVASTYQHMAQVTSRLALRGVTLVGFVIFWINRDVMEDDRVSHGNTIRGTGFSFYLPLADYLPCVIYVIILI